MIRFVSVAGALRMVLYVSLAGICMQRHWPALRIVQTWVVRGRKDL